MAERETIERARRDAREGKAASTQAGEFLREEIEHVLLAERNCYISLLTQPGQWKGWGPRMD